MFDGLRVLAIDVSEFSALLTYQVSIIIVVQHVEDRSYAGDVFAFFREDAVDIVDSQRNRLSITLLDKLNELTALRERMFWEEFVKFSLF